MKFWYLATPYSKWPSGLEDAFFFAVRQRGLLLKAGVACFSPIIHSHPVAVQCGLDPLDHSIWLPSEEPLLLASHGLLVVTADGWRESYGIGEEVKAFNRDGKPIVYMTPNVVPEGLT